eukprot:12722282-Alexandrium_andersonii.AAC.1
MVYLGFGKDVGGQILFDLAGGMRAGANAASLNPELKRLGIECKQWHNERGIYVGHFRWSTSTISWTSHNDCPTLETKMKGAVCKRVLLWLLWKAQDCVDRGADTSSYAVKRACMAWHLARFIKRLDGCSLFLSREAALATKADGCLLYTSPSPRD